MTLKLLLISCFRSNSEQIDPKFPISNMKSRIWNSVKSQYEFSGTSSIMKCLKNFEKMTGFYQSFRNFLSKSLHIHFNPSQNISTILLLHGLMMVINERGEWEGGGLFCSNIARFVHIWNLSNIACYKNSLKFNLFFVSKFKVDRAQGKMLNDTHLKVI